MCPACFMTVTWAVFGKTSAGGLAALVVRNAWGRRIEKVSNRAATDGTSEHDMKGALGPTARIPRRRNEP
jgi:hypothetical protein